MTNILNCEKLEEVTQEYSLLLQSINIPNMFILLNILRHGGMKNAIRILLHIKYLQKEWTKKNIEKLLKQQNKYFLTIKFKKSHQPTRDYRI